MVVNEEDNIEKAKATAHCAKENNEWEKAGNDDDARKRGIGSRAFACFMLPGWLCIAKTFMLIESKTTTTIDRTIRYCIKQQQQQQTQMDTKTEADIPISLGKPSLRRRLEAYYGLINPDSLKDPVQWRSTFQQIYEKYGGTYQGERKLAAKLSKKYGSTVRLLLAESNDGLHDKNKGKHSAASAVIVQQRDEGWFALRPNEQNSGTLDVTSDSFDPVAALQAPEQLVLQVNPWISSCQILNFVDQFRTYLPPNDPLHRDVMASRQPPGTNKKAAADSNSNTKEEPPRKLGVFAAIAEHHKTGPLSLLHRLFEKRQRVRVLIRYVNGIRGTLTGYLVAYDKHYNMILRDVDEVYCPRHVPATTDVVGGGDGGNVSGDGEQSRETMEGAVDVPSSSNLEVELHRRTQALMQTKQQSNHRDSSSSTTRWRVRQRHMKQLMVRGDNVVMVYKAESERSVWPRSSKSPEKSIHGRKVVVVPPDERVGTPGSLIYALQRQQQQQQRRRPSYGQRHDYRS